MSSVVEPVQPSGLVLGRYRPLRPLGTGGSGTVWLAMDETLGLEVALKIIAKEGRAGARAEREAEAATRLRHPHCLRAYGLESDDKHLYIAYEYVPGSTMRQAIRADELGDEGAVEAAAQILDALAFAHAKGIVHRDVKPSNVLVVDGDELSVRLFDFGLAQLADAETLTAVGDVPGTLAYISPERLHGEQAGPPADVWAVGVLLWEALSGPSPVLARVAARDRRGDQVRSSVDQRGPARSSRAPRHRRRPRAFRRPGPETVGQALSQGASRRVARAGAEAQAPESAGADRPEAQARADWQRLRSPLSWPAGRPPRFRSIPRAGRSCSPRPPRR